MSSSDKLKVTIVGDGAVGKTCMVEAYVNHIFPTVYVPTVFFFLPTHKQVRVNGKDRVYEVLLFDTAGQEDYDRLRPLSYPNTTCFMIVFDVSSPKSFESVKEKWLPEVQHHMPKTPIILAGNKVDTRGECQDEEYITREDAEKLMQKIKAKGYFECSAKKMENLEEAFMACIKASVAKVEQERKWRRCTIL